MCCYASQTRSMGTTHVPLRASHLELHTTLSDCTFNLRVVPVRRPLKFSDSVVRGYAVLGTLPTQLQTYANRVESMVHKPSMLLASESSLP